MARTIIGTVTQANSPKTIVVKVERQKTHPIYRKQYKTTKKFMAHDPKSEAKVGDKVSIIECRPISARKHFILERIIEKPVLREESLTLLKVVEERKSSKVKTEETKEAA